MEQDTNDDDPVSAGLNLAGKIVDGLNRKFVVLTLLYNILNHKRKLTLIFHRFFEHSEIATHSFF